MAGSTIPAMPSLPRVIGHRGAAAAAPENTLASLRMAALLGISWVEFDVRLAADRVCVLLHDDRLDRTTSGHGEAARLDSAALRALDAGAWFDPRFAGEPVPTLAEAIGVLDELGLGANVEIKPAPGEEIATARAIAVELTGSWPAGLPPPLLSSFAEDALAAARETAPGIARGFLCGHLPRDWLRRAEALGCAAIHCDHRHLDGRQAAAVTDAGYALLAYTVNDPARARELFSWGVGAVFSDCPDRILAGMLDAHGRRQSAPASGDERLSRKHPALGRGGRREGLSN